jgi:hypothetical protein
MRRLNEPEATNSQLRELPELESSLVPCVTPTLVASAAVSRAHGSVFLMGLVSGLGRVVPLGVALPVLVPPGTVGLPVKLGELLAVASPLVSVVHDVMPVRTAMSRGNKSARLCGEFTGLRFLILASWFMLFRLCVALGDLLLR